MRINLPLTSRLLPYVQLAAPDDSDGAAQLPSVLNFVADSRTALKPTNTNQPQNDSFWTFTNVQFNNQAGGSSPIGTFATGLWDVTIEGHGYLLTPTTAQNLAVQVQAVGGTISANIVGILSLVQPGVQPWNFSYHHVLAIANPTLFSVVFSLTAVGDFINGVVSVTASKIM